MDNNISGKVVGITGASSGLGNGAAATTAITHIAIAEALDGMVVDWMEQVGDK